MGVRKRLAADKRKEEQKSVAFAKLLNIPTSPRKMRLVADMVRGKEVFRALGILKALSQTGKKRTNAKPNPVSSTSALSTSTVLRCSSACVPLPRAVDTVSANAPITLL